jgi:mono/diheme cytochrome c family protein
MMHREYPGRRPDVSGHAVASYTKVTREDSDAIYAYMMSVPPVNQKNRPHELRFPFNQRDLLIGWRALYFKAGEYVPDTKEVGAMEPGRLSGRGPRALRDVPYRDQQAGRLEDLPGVRGRHDPQPELVCAVADLEPRGGLGNWTIKEITDLLQAGISHRATVYGPMAEVVYNSLQYLSDADVEAMAVYLKELPQRDSEAPPTQSARLVSPNVMELGRKVYAKQCLMCHGEEGKGHPPEYPPLASNQSITMSSPVNSIRMVLNGGYAPGTKRNPKPHGMPPFSHILNDDEVAAVVTYIRVAWENSGTPVIAGQIGELRTIVPE